MVDFPARHKALTRLSFLVPLSAWLSLQSCITDNKAAYTGILGETRVSTSGPSEATSNGGTGGGGTGGSDLTSSGGTAGAAGAAGGGGADGNNAASGSTDGGQPTTCVMPELPDFAPRCCEYVNEYGEEIKKSNHCAATDIQECWRECGPASVGWKQETCEATVYTEGNCIFPPGDYSCYSIPEVIDLDACGLTDTPPQALEECDAPTCTLCSVDGNYLDTGGVAKDGWCICREPDENGLRTWTCASETSWPCPLSAGCE